MIKLIATDMDGTFLDSQKKFDPEFLSLFYKLKEKNIIAITNNIFLVLFIFPPSY